MSFSVISFSVLPATDVSFWFQPTVTPAEDFSPEADCEALREAMSGRGTDEDELMAILANR